MILVGVNLLIYDVNQDLAQHAAARRWLQTSLSASDIPGIPWVSLLAFVRVCTDRRIFERPLPQEAALGYVDEWLAQPVVRTIGPGERHWSILRTLLARSGAAANLTTDAHIAALAIEHGYVVFSADDDIKRCPRLRHVNPLAARGTAGSRGKPA